MLLRHFPRLLHWLGRLTGANREAEMALLDILCDARRTSIDVGAKTGMYAWRLLAHSAAVTAFEPNPELAHLLRAVFGRRMAVYETALSDRQGTATLRLPASPPGRLKMGGMLKTGRGTIEAANTLADIGGPARRFEVATRRLDDYALKDVGFIKIDVEGHEMAVLAGAGETIGRCRPNLLVEANDSHAPGAVGRMAAWAEAAGYRVCFLAGNALHSLGEEEIAASGTGGGAIENFILLPRESTALVAAIRARLTGD